MVVHRTLHPTRWLLALARLESSVKVVIAGRPPLAWHQEAGWRTLIHKLPQTGLAPAECHAYLARRGLHAPTLVEQIVQATPGHPLAPALAADLAPHVRAHDFAADPNGTWSRARWWSGCYATSQTRGCGRRWRPVR